MRLRIALCAHGAGQYAVGGIDLTYELSIFHAKIVRSCVTMFSFEPPAKLLHHKHEFMMRRKQP